MTTRETVRALRACDEDEWGEIVESAIEGATAALAARLAEREAENERLRRAIERVIEKHDCGTGQEPQRDAVVPCWLCAPLLAALEGTEPWR